MRRMLAPRLALAAVGALICLAVTLPSTPTAVHSQNSASTGAWTQYHFDDGHTGNDTSISSFTGVTTGWTSPTLDGEVFASPLVFNGVVFAATLQNTVYALNQSTGAVLWS